MEMEAKMEGSVHAEESKSVHVCDTELVDRGCVRDTLSEARMMTITLSSGETSGKTVICVLGDEDHCIQ